MNKIIDSNQAFIIKMQSLYDIEMKLSKALPKMHKAAKGEILKNGFALHLEETKNHITRIEKIFGLLNVKPKKITSEGMTGIIEDSTWVINLDAPENVKDSMIASSARYAEHFEMAGYMTAIIEANSLGLTEIAMILSETLAEEDATDQKLEEIIKNNFV